MVLPIYRYSLPLRYVVVSIPHIRKLYWAPAIRGFPSRDP